MSMHWESFYIPADKIRTDTITFPQTETHHLSRVLRKKRGDSVWVVDGEGTTYQVELLTISRESARGKIIQKRRRIGEPTSRITLAQAVLKRDKFDWIVEKATEIGVERIIPFTSEFAQTVAGTQKISRWRRVAVSAMKQSGRSVLPEISEPMSLSKVLARGSHCTYRLIAHRGTNSQSLSIKPVTGAKTTSSALLVIGPEGGFSDDEVQTAVDQSFTPVSLGPRRLRAETAGLVLCSIIMYQLGELD
jgi:16S rRNA (uracil1498-N3)-methyltransferase